MCLGRRKQASWFLQSSRQWRENLNTCLVQPGWSTRMCNQVRTRDRLPTLPESPRRKKSKKPLRGYFCLLTTGDLISVRLGALRRTTRKVPPSTRQHGRDSWYPSPPLLDHLIRLEEERRGDGEIEHLGGLEVDD